MSEKIRVDMPWITNRLLLEASGTVSAVILRLLKTVGGDYSHPGQEGNVEHRQRRQPDRLADQSTSIRRPRRVVDGCQLEGPGKDPQQGESDQDQPP